MPRQGGDLLHTGITPNIYLILAIAVCAHELVDVFSEHQVTDLATSLNRLQVLELDSVPELDGSVLSAAACREEALLVW